MSLKVVVVVVVVLLLLVLLVVIVTHSKNLKFELIVEVCKSQTSNIILM